MNTLPYIALFRCGTALVTSQIDPDGFIITTVKSATINALPYIALLFCGTALVASQNLNVCSLQEDSGPCCAYIERYFFETRSRLCKQFIYGGCDGNGNNFVSLQECRRACASY